MEPLLFLTYLTLVLLLGIVATIIANKIKIPNILLLILIGILLGNITYLGKPIVTFPSLFLTSIALLALIMIVFDAASSFKFKEFDKLSTQSLKLSVVFLVLNVLVLAPLVMFMFEVKSLFLALLFATLMSGTDPAAVTAMFHNSTNKVFKLLEVESLINTPLMVLLPFIMLDLERTVDINLLFSKFVEQILPFLQQFVAGIGAGVLIGIMVAKIMKKQSYTALSALGIMASALLTYILAENLGGNGILAVTVMGLMFGNFYLKEQIKLQEFSKIFAHSLEILVFILVGLIVKIPLTFTFFISSLVLFLIFLLVRFFSIQLALGNVAYTLKERLFMALNVQKGIAVAAAAFTLITLVAIEYMPIVLHLTVAFMLYSIVLSTIVIKLYKFSPIIKK